MKAQLTATIFRYISKEISNGRPLWGMLRANEYLESQDPLRQALVIKARAHLGNLNQSLVNQVLAGAKLAELETSQREEILELGERLKDSRDKFIYKPSRKTFAHRKTQLRKLKASNTNQ
ncbi:MAG: hypothetical protein R3A13_08670 [Bdellovibrionota bacterium]